MLVAFIRIVSSSTGIPLSMERGGRGSTVPISCRSCSRVSPGKARSSVSSSYIVIPSEYTSVRWSSTTALPPACSGLM